MEYLLIGTVAIIIFLILLVIIKVEKLRSRANALFLEAEKNVTNDKLEYVCNNLYSYIPNMIKLFINNDTFTEIIQMIYDHTRQIAKDLLDDGKLNRSNKEE